MDWILSDPFCQKRGYVARCVSYQCSALTVWLHEKERARSFAEVLSHYAKNGWCIRIIAHSNGTRIVREALKMANWPKVWDVHFVCGACDSDFKRTGFNDAMKHDRIGNFFYYTAGRDIAMKWENTFLGKLDFALPENSKPLGLCGPRHDDPHLKDRIIDGSDDEWKTFGHSTAWTSRHFGETMRTITQCDVSANLRSESLCSHSR